MPDEMPDKMAQQELVEPYRDRPWSPLAVEFLPGRMRFIAHNDTQIRPNARPPFGVALLIWGVNNEPLANRYDRLAGPMDPRLHADCDGGRSR